MSKFVVEMEHGRYLGKTGPVDAYSEALRFDDYAAAQAAAKATGEWCIPIYATQYIR